MKKYVFLFLGLFIIGCTSNEQPMVSFYYWKTIFKLSATEKKVLQENEVTKLYVRYFDVGLKDSLPVPITPIRFQDKTTGFEVVPVIYIKNEVMLDPKLRISELASRTMSMIEKINKVNQVHVSDIQIDCDWTLSSKKNFMMFIEELRKKTSLGISATIRLHQIKYYKETGVPNVDRGVLMYYNMGQISSDDQNSIYDGKLASRYIASLSKYPLSLDVALPVFGWGVHIRNQKVIGLIPKINEDQLLNAVNVRKLEEHRFKVNEDIIGFGTNFRVGDEVKIEGVSKSDLKNMVSDLKKHLKVVPKEVIYYDLDSINIKTYFNEKEFYKKINSKF